MRCLLKPIHWNPAGYTAPAGHPCASGYPHDYGYGHEEWNNSPHLRFEIDGRGHRLLHADAGLLRRALDGVRLGERRDRPL